MLKVILSFRWTRYICVHTYIGRWRNTICAFHGYDHPFTVSFALLLPRSLSLSHFLLFSSFLFISLPLPGTFYLSRSYENSNRHRCGGYEGRKLPCRGFVELNSRKCTASQLISSAAAPRKPIQMTIGINGIECPRAINRNNVMDGCEICIGSLREWAALALDPHFFILHPLLHISALNRSCFSYARCAFSRGAKYNISAYFRQWMKAPIDFPAWLSESGGKMSRMLLYDYGSVISLINFPQNLLQ